jgi:hypothetical protein
MENANDLSAWLNAEEWRASHASSVFRTAASWAWFKRMHRRELVEAGVLILGAGRASDVVHVGKIGGVVQAIRHAHSLKRLQDVAA